MAVQRIVVHSVQVEDKPGALQELLDKAAAENVDFQCFAAFSAGGGIGKVYLTAKNHEELAECAKKAGLATEEAVGFIITAEDKVGAAAAALKGLADAGINGQAGAAMVCGGEYHMMIIVNAEDGDAAEAALS